MGGYGDTMSDTGQIIEVPDEMTIVDAEALMKDTENRFMYEFTMNNFYILCTWRNYYETSKGYRSKDKNGAWKLLAPCSKDVVIV